MAPGRKEKNIIKWPPTKQLYERTFFCRIHSLTSIINTDKQRSGLHTEALGLRKTSPMPPPFLSPSLSVVIMHIINESQWRSLSASLVCSMAFITVRNTFRQWICIDMYTPYMSDDVHFLNIGQV